MHLGIERGRRGLRSKILNVATSTAMKVRSGVVTASRLAHIERKAIFSAECPKEQAHKLSIKVQGEILVYVGDPRGPASTDLAKALLWRGQIQSM